MRIPFAPAAAIALLLACSSHLQAQDRVDFGRDVRPILSDTCFKCHGPDADARQADLRLDRRDDAAAVLEGDSELLRRVLSRDPDERMPPPDSKLSLSSSQIDTLRRWVAQGAPYEQHWSFMRPIKQPLPAIQKSAWPQVAIDHFVLAQLERAGLPPAAAATREQLARRLSFDLTGLPPTLRQLDEFLNDGSPDAVANYVDRLLASHHFGERMAADWLDVARYSDSYGYQVDRDRFVWPWRDWVIRAFNQNLPYDQFVTQQLAGDLLPDADDQQILATTFNRLHPQKVEGGSVPEEFRVEYVADRTHTFATAFLGLTLECCRCHDHKYDPIAQSEYYGLFAFFNNIDEAGLYSYFTPSIPTPTLTLPDDATRQRLQKLEAALALAERQFAATQGERAQEFEKWLNARPTEAELTGQIAHLTFEEENIGANARVPGRIGQAVRLTGDDAVGLSVGNFRRFDPFTVALWMQTPDVKQRAVVFHRSRAWTDAASRGYQLLIEDGRLSASLIHFWPGNAIRIRTRQQIPIEEWVHVAMVYDGSSRADGLRLFVNGRPAECDVVRDKLTKNINGGGGDNIAIGERFRDRGFTRGLVDEFRVFDRQLSSLEVAHLADDPALEQLLSRPLEQLEQTDRDRLREYYGSAFDETLKAARNQLRQSRQQYCAVADGLQEIMVMRDLPERRPTFVLKRGAYDAPSTPVEPHTPAALPPLSEDAPRNRLGLARWLTHPHHPLTARVAVNHYWQLMFGQGLVRTPEDFGSQGQPPTHPQLLDWMARDFVESGWDVKRLLKQIALSATYQQSSRGNPQAVARDPENRLLSRAPRYRWPAEMIRDNALAVSGLLVDRIGGPPVKPYELQVSFKPITPDKGEGLYRRSLYTFWKRTAPAPVMMSLDASKRDVCVVRRERTASPLQALVLLNGPQFVEAARVLGEQLCIRHGDDNVALLRELFRQLTSRYPTERELDVLTRLLADHERWFAEHPDQADKFLATGTAARLSELPATKVAAAGLVVSGLLNFDECITKR